MIHAGKKYANKAALRGAVINASNYCGVAVRVRANRSNQQRISFGCHSVPRNGDRNAEGACKFIVNAKYVQADGAEPACWEIKDDFILEHQGTCNTNAETQERVQQLVFSIRDMAPHVADYMKVHGTAPRIKHLMKHLDSVLKLPPGTIKDHHARRAVEAAHTFVYGKAEDSYGVLFEWILTNRRADNDFVGLLEYALVPIEVYDPATMSMHASYEQSITSKMLSLPIPADIDQRPSTIKPYMPPSAPDGDGGEEGARGGGNAGGGGNGSNANGSGRGGGGGGGGNGGGCQPHELLLACHSGTRAVSFRTATNQGGQEPTWKTPTIAEAAVQLDHLIKQGGGGGKKHKELMMRVKAEVPIVLAKHFYRISVANPTGRRAVATGLIRPMVFADFCHCSSPDYGALFHLGVLTPGDHYLALAWTYCPIENLAQWRHGLEFGKAVCPWLNGEQGVLIITDAFSGKGVLKKLVSEVLPNAVHVDGSKHFLPNLITGGKNEVPRRELVSLFWALRCDARTPAEYEAKRGAVAALGDAPHTNAYLDYDKDNCRAFLGQRLYGRRGAQSPAESLHAALNRMNLRNVLPPIMIVGLYSYHQRRSDEMRLEAQTFNNPLFKNVRKRVDSISAYVARMNRPIEFQTTDRRIALVGTSQAGKSVLVNLIEGTCECQEWTWTGVPCSHAAYLIQQINFSLTDFIYGELRVGTAKQFWKLVGPTKKVSLQPFPDMRNSGMRGLPRTFVPQGRKKKTAGRRKHKRIPSAMDGPAAGGSSGGGSGSGVRKCGRCGSQDHYRGTCKKSVGPALNKEVIDLAKGPAKKKSKSASSSRLVTRSSRNGGQ